MVLNGNFGDPDDHKNIKFPRKRRELILLLQEIVDGKVDDIDYIVHFLFDDNYFYGDNVEDRDNILFENEISQFSDLLGDISDLIDKIGDRDTSAYLESVNWSSIKSKASKLYDLMIARDVN